MYWNWLRIKRQQSKLFMQFTYYNLAIAPTSQYRTCELCYGNFVTKLSQRCVCVNAQWFTDNIFSNSHRTFVVPRRPFLFFFYIQNPKTRIIYFSWGTTDCKVSVMTYFEKREVVVGVYSLVHCVLPWRLKKNKGITLIKYII